MVKCLFYLASLVNLVKYSNNCKNSVVYMVKAYGSVAINGPFDNELTKTSNGYVRCRHVGKGSSQNLQCQIK